MDGGDKPRFEPFGPTSHARHVVAALVVMAGAVPVALVADRGGSGRLRLYTVLLAIGIVGTTAWLVDGRRYLGAGIAALALGIGYSVVERTTVDEYAIVYGFLGTALLLVSRVNPRALGGSAGLLLYTSISSLSLHGNRPLAPRAIVFASIMLMWGGTNLRRDLRGRRTVDHPPAVGTDGTTGHASVAGAVSGGEAAPDATAAGDQLTG